jgi:hypothetical protein
MEADRSKADKRANLNGVKRTGAKRQKPKSKSTKIVALYSLFLHFFNMHHLRALRSYILDLPRINRGYKVGTVIDHIAF